MSNYPTTFVSSTMPIDASSYGAGDQELINKLKDKSYEIHVGLTKAYAEDISKMSLQPSIMEYCPNDSGRRFKDLASTEVWLAKGRAAILLLKKDEVGVRLAGYGWAGHEQSSFVPTGESTFALRLNEADQGQGLATPYARLIVSTANVLYGAQNMWLETWGSDSAAVHIYHKLGFIDVTQVDGVRKTADGLSVPDTRFYMSLPNELL